MAREPARRSAALLGLALDGGPPRGGEHGRQRKHGEQRESRVDRDEQGDRHGEPQDPPGGGKHRHIHVIEHEHLIAQHREPVEKFGPLLVGDGGHRRLQPGHMGFERDRDLVAEAALHAGADRAQQPRGRGGDAERDRGDAHDPRVPPEHAFAEQLEPPGQQGVRQGREPRQHECREHEPGLMAVAELAQPPHRRQRGRQVRRGRHR
jgi:hypothetical protein